jgi:RNA 2',3'-cyclic 3'-phosphodiesterase
MPRLFTGLSLPDSVSLDLQIMQGGIPGANWLSPENHHLTIRFIGDVETGIARELAQSLQTLAFAPFELRLKSVGLFGGNKPHSIYAGVEDSEALRRLHHQHERLCQDLGLPPEHRKFKPHVTLAKLKQPEPKALQRWIEVHSLYSSPAFTVDGFMLYSSRPFKGGGPYAIEADYAARREPAQQHNTGMTL